ncbi:MAG: hypothetical protein ACM30G_11470 [Micromonosporaceae bacterium]
MSTPRRHRIDREAAERLLGAYERGSPRYPVRGVPARDPLADLLTEAAAVSPADPAGEEAAVAAFRAARVSVPHAARRRSMLARMLTLPAALALGAVAAGGLALAASTGVLPTPLHPGTAAAPTVNHRPTTPARASTHPGASAAASGLLGLCQAYDHHVGPERGRALDTPAFGDLVVAAGGKANVDDFCAGLLASEDATEPPMKSAPPSRTPNPHASRTPH